jgi:hypothetical protein
MGGTSVPFAGITSADSCAREQSGDCRHRLGLVKRGGMADFWDRQHFGIGPAPGHFGQSLGREQIGPSAAQAQQRHPLQDKAQLWAQ